MVHRSPVIIEDCTRLIIRITCEYEKLLDPNDTNNPFLPFEKPFKFDVRNRLTTYDYPVNYNQYGFSK